MATDDPQELIPCPFDPVHMVQRKRMQYHIMKCKKNMDMSKFRKCPFNAQHVVLVEEYEHHVRTCDGRSVVEKELMYQRELRDPERAQGRGNLDVPQSSWVVPETTESWDNDDFTVVVGSSKSPSAPPTRPVEKPKTPTNPRLPLRGQTEGSKVFEYSVSTQSTASKPTGKGRGRGRGLAKLVSSGPRPGGGSRLPPKDVSPSTSEVPTEAESVSLTVEEKRAKDIRKLKKMLRQTEKIEQMESEGNELNPDQLEKLDRKEDVLASLQLLQSD